MLVHQRVNGLLSHVEPLKHHVTSSFSHLQFVAEKGRQLVGPDVNVLTKISTHMGMSENGVYPNEIAIFHRDNDH